MKHLSPITPKISRDVTFKPTQRYGSHQKMRLRIKNDSIEELKSFVPDWLSTNRDFISCYKKMKHQVDINLAEVCQKLYNNRNNDEKKALINWVKDKPFFSNMSKDIVKKVCNKLSCSSYKPGEVSKKYVVIHEKEEPNCMYIIYEGIAGIYRYNQRINQGDEGDPLGENALENDVRRTATVIAESSMILFKLKRSDYEDIMLTVKKNEKKTQIIFLRSIPVFNSWNDVKIMMLSHAIIVSNFSKGEIVYEPNDFSHSFYIIKQGTMELQTEIKILEENKWPISPREWNVRKVTKKIYHPVKTLGPKDYFGHVELLDKTFRQTRALATSQCMLFIINRSSFEELFNPRDQEMLKNDSEIPSKEEIEIMIKKSKSDILEKEKIIMNAMIENKRGYIGQNKKFDKWMKFVKERIVTQKNNMKKTIVKHTLENIKLTREDI